MKQQAYNKTIYDNGQILIELIIAVSLMAIIVSSIIVLFVDIGQAQLVSLEQTQAEGYTEEAIESLYSIRERSWNDLVNHNYPSYPQNNGGVWELSDGQEIINDNYTRQITMETVYRNSVTGEIAEAGVEDSSTKKFIITVGWQKPRALSITKEIYLTRYQNNINWTETTKNDFDDGTTNNIRAVNNDGGELELDYGEGEGEHTGNKFSVFQTSSTDNLDHKDKKVSFRFTAQDSKEVEAIRIYIHSAHPTQSPKYKYGLQTDNGDGSSSGTWLGEDQKGYAKFKTNDTGWHELELEEEVDLTEGEIYHLVVEHYKEQINPAKYISLRVLYPLNRIVSYDGSDDENLMIRFSEDKGLSWADVNKNPVFILIYDNEDLEAAGNPYHEGFDGSVWGDHYKGETFIYSDATEFISRVGVYVYLKKNVPNQPQDDLYIVIEDLTIGETLIDQLFVARDEVSTDYNLKETSFNPPLTMVQGRRYRLYLYSNGTSHNRAYQIGVAENVDQNPDNEINYLDADAKYTESNNAGDLWTEYINRDTMFRFSTVADAGYFANGEYVSSIFDTGSSVSFNRLFWTESINPGITNTEFQIAVNNDGSTWNFVGPDGTGATRFTDPEGGSIPLNYSLGQYFRYKLFLTTIDNEQTPILFDMNVNYSP